MKNIEKVNINAGCNAVTDQKRGMGERIRLRRVLWRRDRIVVYQDTTGRYWWADLDGKKQRAALIVGTRRT
jgi:hypothetical protein